jgi:hypothetical protein
VWARLVQVDPQPARPRPSGQRAQRSRQGVLLPAQVWIRHARVHLGSCDGEGALVPGQMMVPRLRTVWWRPLPQAPAPAQLRPLPVRAPADQHPGRELCPPQSMRVAVELVQVRCFWFPGIFCGAAGARASICACTVCNTMTALGQSASRVRTTTASLGIQ